ncbi:hypothetical protein PENTCL1PPCAC_100, partial [Pristionchus entomophagus]
CKELNDDVISQALADGEIRHHRYPEIRDRMKHPLKIKFAIQKTRDHFLFLVRTSPPHTVTKFGGAFIRRDLCPFELEMERQARIDAWTNNVKIGALAYGVRDEKLIKFTGIIRPLPDGYADCPPRGSIPEKGIDDRTLRVVIKNFSKMDDTLCSNPKRISDVPWQIMVMPK